MYLEGTVWNYIHKLFTYGFQLCSYLYILNVYIKESIPLTQTLQRLYKSIEPCVQSPKFEYQVQDQFFYSQNHVYLQIWDHQVWYTLTTINY